MAEMPNFVPLSTPTPTLPLVQLPRSFGLLVNRPSWPIRRSNAVLKSMSVSPNEPKPNREERRPERQQVGARKSEGSRAGKECVRQCKYWRSVYYLYYTKHEITLFSSP